MPSGYHKEPLLGHGKDEALSQPNPTLVKALQHAKVRALKSESVADALDCWPDCDDFVRLESLDGD